MIVTKIEPLTKTKYKVYIDEEFAFVLYKGELSRYHIQEDNELSAEVFQKLKYEVIFKRAKLRAMHLLNDMDRTETQLREKLRLGYYTEDIIEKALEYVKSFGYINDAQYARRYIESKKATKSKKEIYAGLCKKGLSQEIIDLAMEEIYDRESEIEAVCALLRKKHYNLETADDSEKQKIYGYLARKGFPYETIRQVIQVSDWNA